MNKRRVIPSLLALVMLATALWSAPLAAVQAEPYKDVWKSNGRTYVYVENEDGSSKFETHYPNGTYTWEMMAADGSSRTEYYTAGQLLSSYDITKKDEKGNWRTESYNDIDVLQSYWIESESEDGRQRTDYFDAKGNRTSYNVSYENEQGYVWESYDAQGFLNYYDVYDETENGLPRTRRYNLFDTLLSYTLTDGTTTTTYEPDGSVITYTVKEGNRRTRYDADGKVTDWWVYDENGDVFDEWHMDRSTSRWYPSNTACTFGLSVRDLKPEVTDKWYNVTPVDLSKDGVTVLDLWASNVYIIGKVLVKVEGDSVTVTYSMVGADRGLARIEKEFFTFLPDFDGITTMEPEELGEGFKYGEPLSIEKDLNGNKTPLLFVRNVLTYRDEIKPGQKLMRLWPNLPHRREMRDEMLKMIGR